MIPTSPWMTPNEAAEYLRKPAKTGARMVVNLARAGRIKYVRDGWRYLFRREFLDDYLSLNTKN